jgi:hypothetical protein
MNQAAEEDNASIFPASIPSSLDYHPDIMLEDALVQVEANSKPPVLKNNEFSTAIKRGYHKDSLMQKIFKKLSDHKLFKVLNNSLLLTTNFYKNDVVCISRVSFKDKTLIKIILKQAYKALGHYRHQKVADYVCKWY